MRLTAAELSDEGQNRGRVFRLAGQPSQRHARVLAQRAREAGAFEELDRVFVVLRRGAGYHLLQRNGELVRIERPPFPDFFARLRDLVPGLHSATCCGRTNQF